MQVFTSARHWLQLALAAGLMLIGACGGGGDGPGRLPSIGNLRLSPATAAQAPGQYAPVLATIDFTEGGAARAAVLHVVGSGGVDLRVPVSVPGGSSGSVTGEFPLPLDTLGTVAIEIWLEDDAGNSSIRLPGSFQVVVNDSALSWRPAQGATALEGLLADASSSLLAGAWNGRLYVFTGRWGLIVTSPDLVQWTRIDIGLTAHLTSIAWSGTEFVVSGSENWGEALLLRSTDGITWARTGRFGHCPPRAPACSQQSQLSSVVWAGTQFVALGYDRWMPDDTRFALRLTSPDGQAWEQHNDPPIQLLAATDAAQRGFGSAAWSGDVLVATGSTPTGDASAWTSVDGATWAARGLPLQGTGTLLSVAWARGRFVALADGVTLPAQTLVPITPAALTSTDGITWVAMAAAQPLPHLDVVAAGPHRFLAIGPAAWLTSAEGLPWAATGKPAGPCGDGVFWDGVRWVAFGATVCVSP